MVDDPKSAEVREACGTGEEAPTPIGTRWLIHRKLTGKVKARLVAQQIKWTNDGMDTFAATATSAGARLLLAILAKRNRSGEDYVRGHLGRRENGISTRRASERSPSAIAPADYGRPR